ncbi:MAG: translation elongation factor Ts [Candidatus Doudnabacteria bacterium RIFCSPLOWO2_02_FULL_49_13]|uniref:Elongation factor Ts n=1 Tax=Candidatus Doudnabacteria bacterium RIFCSPHIGHO2_12_FULL_48_16 TaxID=1817838 RepID=A0A1F5PLD5_9BACT|nr:MAG: translation elongation factor Ts [Candidatus Doudnabacteria bacterium RIFCSPHIGHO2_02_FULL_49_24]OGE88801.1 MAG: translation elongation factor Ts [Candidatus Doudnabacteria bacterium RIFCSPHIGHO2_01_FULL_50_67]OGE90677.1 MAG: translation elongation factor Ts [Candidatus Doudnabacteria bacterium RIFCSPHIGHO2_12_FULL_48_16]OGE97008.1 MAG: translation elongation factor Ts [Candidatus Doudnabacteria bacterium RIFCSPLOWO2_01_FULL_49_40]OGF02542.1 MAG: translation elongation factor Ts [Candid
MNITPDEIKKLRDQTGAGMMDAKKALQESASFQDAVVYLRKKGHASLAKKAERSAKEGIITSYIHAGDKVGVLLELNCETDFVARNQEFKELGNEIALHIAAASPLYVSREEVPANAIDNEKQIYAEQIKDKPANMQEQIMAGKLEKYYEQVCLLDQPYVREPDKKVKDLVAEKVGKLGENIQVRRFVRFVLGV